MKAWRFTVRCLFIFLLFLTLGAVKDEKKIAIGTVEEVILLPWNIRLPARIDTGAAKASLDARELKIHGTVAEFRLPEDYGGMLLSLPIVEWRHVRSSKGRERRPVVEVDLCIASKRVRIKANLNDRSMVKYPIILGRNALKDHFIVDVKRSKIIPPVCPDRLDRQGPIEPQPPLQTSK